MNHKCMLISVLLMQSVFTICCQEQFDQKIQQLKDVWLQKAQEVSALGQKIDEKYELMKEMVQKCSLCLFELYSNIAGNEKDDLKQSVYNTLANFNNAFIDAFNERAIKGFIVKNCIKDGVELSFDLVKITGIRLILEHELLKKLIEKYENCVAELAEIDYELSGLIGRPD